jgi:hypothetical protein
VEHVDGPQQVDSSCDRVRYRCRYTSAAGAARSTRVCVPRQICDSQLSAALTANCPGRNIKPPRRAVMRRYAPLCARTDAPQKTSPHWRRTLRTQGAASGSGLRGGSGWGGAGPDGQGGAREPPRAEL